MTWCMYISLADICEAGHSRDQAENLIHEHRIQIMKAFETSSDHPDIPPEFRDRVSRRHQAFVEHLNFTMLSLVGGDSDAQARHRKIASIASELNIKVFAYRGTFEEISPQMKEPFNSQGNEEENPAPDFPDLEGQPVLVTMMMGVRFKHPEVGVGGEQFSCSDLSHDFLPTQYVLSRNTLF